LQTLLTDDFRAKGATRELTKQQALNYLQIFFTAFPDHRFGFMDFEEMEEWVYCTGQETGTHQGILDLNPFRMPISLPQRENPSNCRKACTHFVWQVQGYEL
jgi:hypothetical protein